MKNKPKTVSLPQILRAHTALIKDEIREKISKLLDKLRKDGNFGEFTKDLEALLD